MHADLKARLSRLADDVRAGCVDLDRIVLGFASLNPDYRAT
jgi:hypothetical protein